MVHLIYDVWHESPDAGDRKNGLYQKFHQECQKLGNLFLFTHLPWPIAAAGNAPSQVDCVCHTTLFA